MKLLVALLMQLLIIFSAVVEFAHAHDMASATQNSSATDISQASSNTDSVTSLTNHQSPVHQHCLNCHDVGGCAHAFLGAARVSAASYELVLSPIASSESLYVGPHSKGLKRPPIS